MQKKHDDQGRWVYCRWIIRNGRKIYPRRKRVFRFWVSDRKRKK